MVNERIRQQIAEVHAARGRVCLVVTGAGTQAIAWLFAEPGASRTVLDAQVPYSMAALDDYVKVRADQHVSAAEAARMADVALARARDLAHKSELPDGAPLAGVSCTAAIAADRERRGEERVHVGLSTSSGMRKTYSLEMVKGVRDRIGEEEVCSRLVLNAVSEAMGLDTRASLLLLEGEEVIEGAG